jgi:hypothetical protein
MPRRPRRAEMWPPARRAVFAVNSSPCERVGRRCVPCPAEGSCRAHAAAAAEVGRLAALLADAFERMASEAGGRSTVEGRAALAGLEESRHQSRTAVLHAEQVELLCGVLPRRPATPVGSSAVDPRREVCADGTTLSSADGVVFISGQDPEPWTRAGGGRHVLRVAHHVELEPPEIVVVRLHATRLAAEGLRASMRPAEPAAGRKQGASPGDAPWTRVVVVIGADDVNPEASVNFAAVWAFAPRPDSRACRTGTVDAWWSSEGTAVLSFGRRGRISETPGGGATWQTLEAADREGPLAQAGMGRGGRSVHRGRAEIDGTRRRQRRGERARRPDPMARRRCRFGARPLHRGDGLWVQTRFPDASEPQAGCRTLDAARRRLVE